MTRPYPRYQVIGPDGAVGEPGSAYDCFMRADALNQAANPDPEKPRVVLYKTERMRDEPACLEQGFIDQCQG